MPLSEPTRRWPARLWRLLLTSAGLAAWFATQALLTRRGFPLGGVRDTLFTWTAPAHAFLVAHPAWANALLMASSAGIDILGIFLILQATFGRTIRPFLGLLVLFILRQVCQGLVSLPAPEGMIWRDPGFPSSSPIALQPTCSSPATPQSGSMAPPNWRGWDAHGSRWECLSPVRGRQRDCVAGSLHDGCFHRRHHRPVGRGDRRPIGGAGGPRPGSPRTARASTRPFFAICVRPSAGAP
jgi:hypothetical protein